LASVRRVVEALPVHRLPGADPKLLGLAEHAGEPLAVLDLARLVGAGPGAAPRHPVTVLVWSGPAEARELVALAADAALEVVELAGDDLVAGEAGLVPPGAGEAGTVVRVLDPARLGDGPVPGGKGAAA
jgi:chemotaxis signal transduction protein